MNFKAGLSDTEIVGHFKFQNTGTSSVAITAVAVSCDCVSASASMEDLGPGQSAEIVATVSLTELLGSQSKDIFVETNGNSDARTDLKINVLVPAIAEIEPDPIFWIPGEPLEPKRVRITPARGTAIKVTAVRPSNPDNMSASIEPGNRPGDLVLVVTPRANCPTMSGSIQLVTDFPKQKPKSILVHVQVAR